VAQPVINGRVLLLNFSYEPLGTVGVARAIRLIFKGAVFVEEFDETRVLRSATSEYRVPSVVRLRHYVNLRRRRNAGVAGRARIYIRDRYTCQYCGEQKNVNDLTLDHVTPRAQQGRSVPENLVTACVRCNNRKGNRTPQEARMPLLTSQHKLRVGLDLVMLCHYAESRPEWRKYLFVSELETDSRAMSA
jgi:5-methylcytosine-specific restriction endonuclease McrA